MGIILIFDDGILISWFMKYQHITLVFHPNLYQPIP